MFSTKRSVSESNGRCVCVCVFVCVWCVGACLLEIDSWAYSPAQYGETQSCTYGIRAISKMERGDKTGLDQDGEK